MIKNLTLLILSFFLTLHLNAEIILAPSSTLTNQAGWDSTLSYTYFSAGANRIRIGAGTNTVTSSIPYTNNAGTYRLWILGLSVNLTGRIGIALGDGTESIQIINSAWAKTGVITTSVGFTNLSITLTNANFPSTHDFHIAGFYLTSNTNLAPPAAATVANTGSMFIDYTIPTTTNATDVIKGNLIPNSSFESGIVGGWMFSRQNASNRAAWIVDALSTNAHSGSASIRITDSKARYQLASPAFRLRGTNVWRPYTFSFWAKGPGTVTLTGNIVPVIPAVSGFPYTNSFSFNFGNPGTSWTRYSTNIYLCPKPTAEMYFTLQHVGVGDSYYVDIDDVQFEEGSLTDWAPKGALEFQLSSGRNGSVFMSGETPRILSIINNSGSARIITLNLDVYKWDNSKFTNIVASFNIGSGVSTNIIELESPVGTYRVTGNLLGVPGYITSEINYLVFPYSAKTTLKTNSFVGIHANSVSSPIYSNKVWGISWQRTLSPAGTFNWSTSEPTEGNFSWTYADWSVGQMTNNSIILGSFGDVYSGGANTPSFAITNGMVRGDAISNYCYQVVSRYKDRVKYWELINEPQYHFSTNQLAEITTWMVGGIRNADASAFIVAGGGLTDATYATNTWALLPSDVKTKIDAISVHFYPPGTDWMDAETSTGQSSFALISAGTGKPIWNSESGSWGFGVKHGDLVGWVSGGEYVFPHVFEDVFRRNHWQTSEKTLRTALRSIGWNQKYFYYDGRLADYGYRRVDTNPTFYEYDDSLRPDALALYYLNNLLGEATIVGKVTNTLAGTAIEAYAFQTESGQSVIAAWTYGRSTNKVLTTTNAAIDIRNMYGEQISTNSTTVIITRQPRYLISGTLSTSQLSETFVSATVANATDTTAPNVSIDVTPIGLINSSHFPLRFKWTSIDDLYVNTDYYTSNVVTRSKIDGYDSDWSSWSAERFRTISLLSTSGIYRLRVQTKDIIGSITNESVGPNFIVGGPLGQSTSLNVGTATIP